MKLICLDGIPGAGKSTLIQEALEHANAMGIEGRAFHFFSDLPRISPTYRSTSGMLEKRVFDQKLSLSLRRGSLRELCAMACDVFLSKQELWTSQLVAFDRSPLTCYAYCSSLLGEPIELPPESIEVVSKLNPTILMCDPILAHQRIAARDNGAKTPLHAVDVDRLASLQGDFELIGSRFRLPCCDAEQARTAMRDRILA